jgi:hypothetical protein
MAPSPPSPESSPPLASMTNLAPPPHLRYCIAFSRGGGTFPLRGLPTAWTRPSRQDPFLPLLQSPPFGIGHICFILIRMKSLLH